MRIKLFIYLVLITTLISCKSQKLKEKSVLDEDVMKALTEVATIGQLKSITYKFILPEENKKGKVELVLTSSSLSELKYNELDLAFNTAKAFYNKFDVGNEYDAIAVKFVRKEKGQSDTLNVEKTYTFSTAKFD